MLYGVASCSKSRFRHSNAVTSDIALHVTSNLGCRPDNYWESLVTGRGVGNKPYQLECQQMLSCFRMD